MVYGREVTKISDRFSNVTTTEFGGDSLMQSTAEAGKWYRVNWLSNVLSAITKDDVIKVTGHNTYKVAISPGAYVVVPVADDCRKEVGIRVIFILKGSASVNVGVTSGIGLDGTDLGSLVSVGMYGNKLKCSISSDGDPERDNYTHPDSGDSQKDYEGDLLSNFTSTNWTSYELRLYFIRGLDSGGENKYTYFRCELFINGYYADAIKEPIVDEVNDMYASLLNDLRPYILVTQNTSVWIKHVGVYR